MAEHKTTAASDASDGSTAAAAAPATPVRKRAVMRKSMTASEESARYAEMVEAAARHAPPTLVPYLKKAAPVLGACGVAVNRAAPVLYQLYATAFRYFSMLPQDLMMVVFGLALCFFGGIYPAAIAAAEAFRMYGWETTEKHARLLYEETQALMHENRRDNTRDADGNGVADVDEVSGSQLFTRKVQLFMRHANPNRINAAVGGLWQATLGVIGVLKIQFARTVTLGAAIGEVTSKTVGRAALPIITHLLPREYHKWVPVFVKWVCKVLGMMVAWTVQRILSAAHSAMRGGFMAARAGMAFLAKRQGVKFDADKTYMDEAVGFALAALGFYVQLRMGFGLPFIVNIVLFPVSCLEYLIEYMVSS